MIAAGKLTANSIQFTAHDMYVVGSFDTKLYAIPADAIHDDGNAVIDDQLLADFSAKY